VAVIHFAQVIDDLARRVRDALIAVDGATSARLASDASARVQVRGAPAADDREQRPEQPDHYQPSFRNEAKGAAKLA